MVTGAGSVVCALIICFMRLRKNRDKDKPQDTKNLYSDGGSYEKFKRIVYRIALAFGIFLIPVGNIIGFGIYYSRMSKFRGTDDNLNFEAWFWTSLIINIFTPVLFLRQFDCKNDSGDLKRNRWRRALNG
jgi:hypothetical protein